MARVTRVTYLTRVTWVTRGYLHDQGDKGDLHD